MVLNRTGTKGRTTTAVAVTTAAAILGANGVREAHADQAKTADQPQNVAPGAATTPAGADSGSTDELAQVVVTGSRVIRNGDASPTPVTVLSTEELLAAN